MLLDRYPAALFYFVRSTVFQSGPPMYVPSSAQSSRPVLASTFPPVSMAATLTGAGTGDTFRAGRHLGPPGHVHVDPLPSLKLTHSMAVRVVLSLFAGSGSSSSVIGAEPELQVCKQRLHSQGLSRVRSWRSGFPWERPARLFLLWLPTPRGQSHETRPHCELPWSVPLACGRAGGGALAADLAGMGLKLLWPHLEAGLCL